MKALVISNRLKKLIGNIELYKERMPFIKGVVVVSPKEMIESLNFEDDYVTFVDEADFISNSMLKSLGIEGFEHASFNFILRSNCIKSKTLSRCLGEEFIMMDDDNLPLSIITPDVFYKKQRYQAYYYQSFKHIVPEIFCSTSYNVSLVKTRDLLKENGINSAYVFSSHMPQLINRNIFIEACSFFDLKQYNYMICDWSLYFNYGLEMYPNKFQIKPAPVICWPMNISSVPGCAKSLVALFENYCPDNYLENGIFSDLSPITATADRKQQLYYQYLQSFNKNKAWLKFYIQIFLGKFASKRLVSALLTWEQSIQSEKNSFVLFLKAYLKSSADPYRVNMKSRRWPTPGKTIQIVGLFDFPSGLGRASYCLFSKLSKLRDRNIKKVNVSGFFNYPGVKSDRKELITDIGDGTVICMLNPPEAQLFLKYCEFTCVQHKKLINYLWYESNTIPEDWEEALKLFDEVWVDNEFIFENIKSVCHKINLPIKIRPIGSLFDKPADMTHFFSKEKVSILNIFNVNSGIIRKNAIGIIDAFSQLPEEVTNKSDLIIKINGKNTATIDELKALSEQVGFTLINELMSDEEISGLINNCDIYISLHRTEGLGLLPLQAMSYGKPVIATGWSGNMSYMTDESAALIDFQIKQDNRSLPTNSSNMVPSDKALFKEKVTYAEPRIDHATKELERLILSKESRIKLGLNAKMRYQSYCDSVDLVWKQLDDCDSC